MTNAEARKAYDEQVPIRYDGMYFERIKAMRVEKVGGADIHSLELLGIRDTGRGLGEYIVRAKPEDVEPWKK